MLMILINQVDYWVLKTNNIILTTFASLMNG